MGFVLEMVWVIKGGSGQLDVSVFFFFFFFNFLFLRMGLDKASGLPYEIGIDGD